MSNKSSTIDKVNVEQTKRMSPFADLVLSDILWPVLSIAIMIFLVVFIYIPFGFEIPNYISEKSSLDAKLDKRVTKKNSLAAINKGDIEAVDDLVSATLKSEFDVSVLANAVATLASKHSLSSNKMTLSDTPALGFQNVVEEEGEIRGLRSISGVFSYRGSLYNIDEFLNDLRGSSELLVIERLEMQRVPIYSASGIIIGENWNVDLTLKGYSFSDYTETSYDESLKTLPELSAVKELINVTEESSETSGT